MGAEPQPGADTEAGPAGTAWRAGAAGGCHLGTVASILGAADALLAAAAAAVDVRRALEQRRKGEPLRRNNAPAGAKRQARSRCFLGGSVCSVSWGSSIGFGLASVGCCGGSVGLPLSVHDRWGIGLPSLRLRGPWVRSGPGRGRGCAVGIGCKRSMGAQAQCSWTCWRCPALCLMLDVLAIWQGRHQQQYLRKDWMVGGLLLLGECRRGSGRDCSFSNGTIL